MSETLGAIRYRLPIPEPSFDEYRVMQDATRARLIGSRGRRLRHALLAGFVAGGLYALGVAAALYAGADIRLQFWVDRYGLEGELDSFGVWLLALALYLVPVLLIAVLQRRARRRLHHRLFAMTAPMLAGHDLLLGEHGLGRDWGGRVLPLPWACLTPPQRAPGMTLLWHGLDTVWILDRALQDRPDRDAILAFLADRVGREDGTAPLPEAAP